MKKEITPDEVWKRVCRYALDGQPLSVWKGLGNRFAFFESMLLRTERIAARIPCPACEGTCEIIEEGSEFRGICQNTETRCEDLGFGSREELCVYTLDQSRLWEKIAGMLPIHQDVRELENGAWSLGSGATLREETPKGVYGMLSDARGVLRQALLMVTELEEGPILFLDCAAVDGGLGSLMDGHGKRMPVWDVARFDGGESPTVRQIFGEPKPKVLTENETRSQVRTLKDSLKDLGRDSVDFRKMLGTMQTPAALWDWCTATYPYLPTEITRNPERYEGFIQNLTLGKIVRETNQALLPPGNWLSMDCVDKILKQLFRRMYSPILAETIPTGVSTIMSSGAVRLSGGLNIVGRELTMRGFGSLGKLWVRAENRSTSHWDQLYQQFFLDPLIRLTFLPEPARRRFIHELTQNTMQYMGDGHYREWRQMDRWLALWFYCGALIEAGFEDIATRLWTGGEENGKPSWNNMMPTLRRRVPEFFESEKDKAPEKYKRSIAGVKNAEAEIKQQRRKSELIVEIRSKFCFDGWNDLPGPKSNFGCRTFELNGKKYLLPEDIELDGSKTGIDRLDVLAKMSDAHVLILGETGSGKESLAGFIHSRDTGCRGEYVVRNCASISLERAESELFGHVKGAYTGAEKDRPGLFQKAKNGTVFLDEIGALPEPVQTKLLRYLETYQFEPMGSDDTITAKARLLMATNADPKDKLLPDILGRVPIKLRLPPLRERKRDIFWVLGQPEFPGGGGYTRITLRALCILLGLEWKHNFRGLLNECLNWALLGPYDSHVGDGVFDCPYKMVSEMQYWTVFGGYALAVLETEPTKAIEEALPGVLEICKLLRMFGFFNGGDERVETISLQDLIPLAEQGECRFALGWLSNTLTGGPNGGAEKDTAGELADLATTLVACTAWVRKLAGFMEAQETGTFNRLSEAFAPGFNFFAAVSDATSEINLFEGHHKAITKEAKTLAQCLDRLGIHGEDRLICVLCNQGWSAARIARDKRVNAKVSTIKAKLAEFRRNPDLAAYLPVAKAGRPKNSEKTDVFKPKPPKSAKISANKSAKRQPKSGG